MSGKRLGAVRAVAGERFCVALDGGEMLWLTDLAVFTATVGKVRLVCEERGLPDYVPAATPSA